MALVTVAINLGLFFFRFFFSYDINNFVQGECCVTSECYGVLTQHLITHDCLQGESDCCSRGRNLTLIQLDISFVNLADFLLFT